MERFLELHRKIKAKLCKEIFGHTMAVIVFFGLFLMALVDLLKDKSSQPDIPKLLAAIAGLGHFGLSASAILHLKYTGVMELNTVKCKIWVYLEIYNIVATTVFIVWATRHMLPAPFHDWTGTSLLLVIYWLPLIMYKTSQVCRMLEFVSVLNYLQNPPTNSIRSKSFCNHTTTEQNSITTSCPTATTSVTASRPIPSSLPAISLPKPSSSPHIPYEWALIDSINDYTLP